MSPRDIPDGEAYPSVRTITRDTPRSSPSAPPAPRTGVDWRQSVEVREFSSDEPAVSAVLPPPSQSDMGLQKQLAILRWGGLLASAVQIGAAAAIPIATYILVTKDYSRLAIEDCVHWGISLVAGGWGMLALGSMRPAALAIHVMLGAMVAAALAAHNNSEYGDLEARCSLAQFAFPKCFTCPCAALGNCSKADFAPGGSCPGCQAPTTEFCSKFELSRNKILLAVTGPVTVFLMAIPVIFSLLALLKVECAAGVEISNRLGHALAAVNEQMTRLAAHEELGMPLDAIMECVRLLESEGAPAMLHLGDQCRTALARAGFNVAPRSLERKQGGGDPSITVLASPPSIAPSHASHHSFHSAAGHAHSPPSGSPYPPQESWRPQSHRGQPAPVTFTANNGPEGPIYYNN